MDFSPGCQTLCGDGGAKRGRGGGGTRCIVSGDAYRRRLAPTIGRIDAIIAIVTNRFSDSHHRGSVRLSGWDYRTQAYYFVTICTHQRVNLFEDSTLADIAAIIWRLIPEQRHAHGVLVDEWVIMPNYMHGLILLPGPMNATDVAGDTAAIVPGLPFDLRYVTPPSEKTIPGDRPKLVPGSLGAIIGNYKSGVTRRINALRHSPGTRVWQRGYYDHIVRNYHELARIQTYIRDNPARWAEDRDNLDEILKRMTYHDGQ